MINYYLLTTVFCWCAFFTYWGIMAKRVKAAVYAQDKLSRAAYLFFVFFSLFSVYIPSFAVGLLGYQMVPESNWSGIGGSIISVTGVAFAIWARYTLGTNWSARVTLKKEHELIQNGPYSIVRHPIYTGFEMAVLGPAIVVGQLKGFVALAIVFTAHVLKIRMEEVLMNKQFPSQYAAYSKRVKRLIPFIF
jgi:protein-S-isoprenylcysteine O-methyltransferase Ste14